MRYLQAHLTRFWTSEIDSRAIRMWCRMLGTVTIVYELTWALSLPLLRADQFRLQRSTAATLQIPLTGSGRIFGSFALQPITIILIGIAASIAVIRTTKLRISAVAGALSVLSLLAYQPAAQNSGDLLLGSFWVFTAIYFVAFRIHDLSRTAVSPWLVRIIQCQIIIVYVASDVHKLGSLDWIRGDAVGLALRFAPNRWLAATDLIDRAPVANAVLTWGSILLELAIAAWLIRPRTYKWALWAGIVLHGAILLTFDVGLFSFVMVIGLAAVARSQPAAMRPNPPLDIRTEASAASPGLIVEEPEPKKTPPDTTPSPG